MIGIHGKTIRHFETAIIIERFFYLSRGAENRVGEYELYLNITIESYDMITTRQGCFWGSMVWGKDIGPDWQKANSDNGATVSISGDIVIPHREFPTCASQTQVSMTATNRSSRWPEGAFN